LSLKTVLIPVLVFVMLITPMFAGMIFEKNTDDKKEHEEKYNFHAENVKIYRSASGIVDEVGVEEYIKGVLMAEVPYDFGLEALKAMAVAARSYSLRRIKKENTDISHYSADMCDDYTHCMSYISFEEAVSKWGKENAEKYYESISEAVEATKGQILIYDGEVADTVFHSSSSEYTESAVDVWGIDVPYLVSVASPESISMNSTVFSSDDFKNILIKEKIYIMTSTEPSEWIKEIKKTKSGRIAVVNLCGKEVSGKRLREIFGLKSTMFDLIYCDGEFTFNVKGSGHGVGMSQYGCMTLARDGKNYKEILEHYYPGTVMAFY